MGKHGLVPFVAAMLLLASASVGAAQLEGFAYAQLTGEDFYGDNEDPEFGFDRTRVGLKGSNGPVFGFLQLDYNVPWRSPAGTLPNWVKDVYLGYDFGGIRFRAGQFKAPVGMDFNVSGKQLDITKRGLEKPLVLERDVGLMLSGRNLGKGFGYDLGLFNPAGRSGAVFGGDHDPFDQVGEDFAYAARLLFDPDEQFHFEASYGLSEDAGGPDDSQSYRVFDLGAAGHFGRLNLKAEYIDGRDVLGTAGRDQSVYYLQTGLRIARKLEGLVRHYAGDSEVAGVKTDLTNTYFGLNLFLGPNDSNGRVQINYVLAGGDERAWNGLGGFRSDGLLVQLQLAVEQDMLAYF